MVISRVAGCLRNSAEFALGGLCYTCRVHESLDPELEVKNYPWPASQVTKADMIRLSDLRERLGRPITKLLHEAIWVYHRVLSEILKTAERCCENPQLRWNGTRENATIVCLSCGFVLADDGQLADWNDPEQIAWQRDGDEPSDA
jgi:hypothetical protein